LSRREVLAMLKTRTAPSEYNKTIYGYKTTGLGGNPPPFTGAGFFSGLHTIYSGLDAAWSASHARRGTTAIAATAWLG